MDDDPQSTLAALESSLDRLEAVVAPLFEKSWNDTSASLAGPLERAKADVLLSYAINNLVWVFLRSKGIEPDTHDVSGELERIKTYYTKVREAENPSRRTRTVDKAAAHRFVSAAIPASQRLGPSSSAAAIARAQALAATANEGPRMADRFRFVGAGGEKVVPGTWSGEEDSQGGNGSAEVDGDGDVEMVHREDEPTSQPMVAEGSRDSDASAAEELLASVDAEIASAAVEEVASSPAKSAAKPKAKAQGKAKAKRMVDSRKRKRAQDF